MGVPSLTRELLQRLVKRSLESTDLRHDVIVSLVFTRFRKQYPFHFFCFCDRGAFERGSLRSSLVHVLTFLLLVLFFPRRHELSSYRGDVRSKVRGRTKEPRYVVGLERLCLALQFLEPFTQRLEGLQQFSQDPTLANSQIKYRTSRTLIKSATLQVPA